MGRAFTDQLRDFGRGKVAADATERMAELVKRVRETGKSGTLTLEVKVKPASRASGAMFISAKIATKLPETGIDETMLFDTPEGALVGEDPAQKKLDLHVAEAPAVGSLKSVVQ